MESTPPPPHSSSADLPLHRRWPVRTMFLSWFGLGLLGTAPGTLGSAGSLPFAAIIVWTWGQNALLSAATAVFLLGWILAALHLRDVPGEKDPQWIVIDEVAGQWATVAVVPLSPIWYLAAFALFRLFDITKPWPVSWADRKVPGALGIMLDDALAGLYAAIILITVRMLLLRYGPNP